MKWLAVIVVCLNMAITYSLASEYFVTKQAVNVEALTVVYLISIVSLYISLYYISRK